MQTNNVHHVTRREWDDDDRSLKNLSYNFDSSDVDHPKEHDVFFLKPISEILKQYIVEERNRMYVHSSDTQSDTQSDSQSDFIPYSSSYYASSVCSSDWPCEVTSDGDEEDIKEFGDSGYSTENEHTENSSAENAEGSSKRKCTEEKNMNINKILDDEIYKRFSYT